MKFNLVLLSLTVVVAAMLRGLQASESLWLDELHTSWTVNASLSEVAERAAIGNQSPLYFWIAWFFSRISLSSEIALRLPSLLAGCALPVAVWWLAKNLQKKNSNDPPTLMSTADETVALLAAWLVAVDPQAIFYSQEARPYALLILVAVFHFSLLLKFLEQSAWPPRIGWIVSGALLVHLHYTGGLILLAELIAFASLAANDALQQRSKIAPSEPTLKVCFNCLIDFGALILLLLPAIPGMLAVAERRENWEQFVKPQDWYQMLRMFPWTPAIIALIILNSWLEALPQRSLVLLSCWLLVPLGVAWLTTQLGLAALFHQRYLIAVLPASLLAAALCIRLGANPAAQSALIGVVLAVSAYNGGLVFNWLHDGRLLHERNEDWRSAVAALNLHLQLDHSWNTAVLVRSGLIEADELPKNSDPLFREYCLCPVRGIYRLEEADQVYPLTFNRPGQLVPAAGEVLKGKQNIWLLARSPSKREELLRDLQQTIVGNEVWEPAEPEMFGQVYLQRINLRKLLPPLDK